MDAENDNDQPNSSSSAGSSNNSSSSNLLGNLPMLHAHADGDEALEDRMPLHPPSPPTEPQTPNANAPSNQTQALNSDSSVFISPLLFNNTTPLPSSSSSSSSSSLHNLHHFHHHQHTEHLHHQHSPHPIHQQHGVPSLAPDRDTHTPEVTIDANAIADTIDVPVVETTNPSFNSSADTATTSQQQATSGAAAPAATGDGLVNEQPVPPSTLPLLEDEAKPPTHVFAQHFSHTFTPPHQRQTNKLFGFEYCKTNGAKMFSGNDARSGPHCSGAANAHQHHAVDRLKLLYPNVNETETPLPRCWSPHDKCLSIGLSQNNLRVHYKGVGKQHNDAASVRTAYPIPPACGIYYFEVKIISKGKNGYMGIGLTCQQFRMNRLPGWDKQSYGYHGDDGNSFSSSGNGQSYGPTFTTGDIIGCCVNFVNNTCFYTKNGIDLGIAFRDLPTKLYPTVGLQTPGEEVDANFGQEPFKFDQIEDMMKQMRAEIKQTVYDFPMPVEQGDPTTLLHKMVQSYLVHNGFSHTAEAFAKTTGQTFQEDITSIRNRQKILKLVMSGKMGHAIEHTLRSYPGLLEDNKNLWFMLKCRQFIEMVNGSDVEYCPNKSTNSTQTTPPNQTSVIQSTKAYQNGNSAAAGDGENVALPNTKPTVIGADDHQDLKYSQASIELSASSQKKSDIISSQDYFNDVEMDNNGQSLNGTSCKSVVDPNRPLDVDEEMEIDVTPLSRKYSPGIERILEFGKELSQMGQQLEKENKMNDEDRQMLEDAFSLIAYSNPWSSPLGWQLCPSKRENVCTALNSAILYSMNYPRRPPLDVCAAHAAELLKVMAHASLGACAFINIEDVFPQN